jgi:hypothetical protein
VKDEASFDQAREFYEQLIGATETEEFEALGARVLMLRSENFSVELLLSVKDDGIVADHPGGLRHISFKTDNLEESIDMVRRIDPTLIKEGTIPFETTRMKGVIQFTEKSGRTGNIILELADFGWK